MKIKNNIEKVIWNILIFLLVISILKLPQVSFAEEIDVNVIVQGKYLYMPEKPILKENRIYLPIKYFAQSLDYNVEWLEEERTVKLINEEGEILLPLGKKEILIDNKKVALDEKSFIEKERSYIPLRSLSEALSYKVQWDQKNKLAIVGDLTVEEETLYLNKNYNKIYKHMKKESIGAFSPYYELLDFQISNYEEKQVDGKIESTFNYKIIDKNYDKDPDTVDYIKKLKESGHRDYQQLYDEYLQAKESNFEFKIIIDKKGEMTLYSNASPDGTQWRETEMDNYIVK